MKINVTDEMKEAGRKMASDLVNALVSKEMNGIGGNLGFDDFAKNYTGSNIDIIRDYINGNVDAVTAIYIAMERAKNESV